MPLNPALLRESISLAASHEPRITKRFYEILFTRYPQVKPMFSRNAPEKQQEMLQSALLAVLDHLDDANWLSTTLGGLGAKHVSYGVTDDMYPLVGECLIATLAELCGPAWTPAHEAAWSEAYAAIMGLTLAGAAKARAAS
jgi:hemoglobin-like flavoprotein